MAKINVFNDPWRVQDPSVAAASVNKPRPAVATPPKEYAKGEDNGRTPAVTGVVLDVPQYGGISVRGTDNTQEAAKRILEFCIKYIKNIEATLLQYGILVVRLKPNEPIEATLAIRRSDGWLLAIPDVTTREQGLLQLVQAFLALQAIAAVKPLLETYDIYPYKL